LEEREQFLELLKRYTGQEQPKSCANELATALALNGIKLTVPPKATPEVIARFKAWKLLKCPVVRFPTS
jgi:hypothetical protein